MFDFSVTSSTWNIAKDAIVTFTTKTLLIVIEIFTKNVSFYHFLVECADYQYYKHLFFGFAVEYPC